MGSSRVISYKVLAIAEEDVQYSHYSPLHLPYDHVLLIYFIWINATVQIFGKVRPQVSSIRRCNCIENALKKAIVEGNLGQVRDERTSIWLTITLV